MMNTRKPYLKQVNVVDVPALTPEGEVYTAHKKVKIVQEDKEQFIFMYSYIQSFFNNTATLTDIKVITYIAMNMDYNSPEIKLDLKEKLKMSEYIGISKAGVERSIKSLRKEGIIIKDEKYPRSGRHYINPMYVWRGDRGERKKTLSYTLEMTTGTDNRATVEDIKRMEEYYGENL